MLKLIIIDDEYYFRQSLKQLINYSDYGFMLIGDANNGESGYNLICEKDPDVVLVDINMPLMNGLALIEKCYNNKIECTFIIITGYSEFEYAQKAIKFNVANYILKPISVDEFIKTLTEVQNKICCEKNEIKKIETSILQNKHLLKESIMNKYINSYYSSESETNFCTELNEYISSSYDNYIVALVVCEHEIDCEKIEQLKMPTIHLLVFHTTNKHVCIIINYGNGIDISNIINKIYTNLHKTYKPQINFFCGNEYKGENNIYHSYNEALSAIRSKNSNCNSVIYYKEINSKYANELIPEITKNKIITSINNSNIEITKKILIDVFNNCKIQKVNYNTFTLVAINLLNTIFTSVFKYSMDNFMSLHNIIINMIINNNDIQIIEEAIINVSLKIIDNIPKSEVSPLVTSALNYINKEYKNQNLNIKLISKTLNVNYGYLCTCFKNDMKITLNKYITDLRLEKAKKCFDEGFVNISLVSSSVGYPDISYFSKCYKKKFGISPMYYIQDSCSKQNIGSGTNSNLITN